MSNTARYVLANEHWNSLPNGARNIADIDRRLQEYFGEKHSPGQSTIRNIIGQNKTKSIKNSTFHFVNNVFTVMKKINAPKSDSWVRSESISLTGGGKIDSNVLVYVKMHEHMALSKKSPTEIAKMTGVGDAHINAMLRGEPTESGIVRQVFEYLTKNVPADGPHQPMVEKEYLVE